MDKCQQFIDKVSKLRFLKLKERQINKFNRLLLKKEGNIAWFINRANPHAGSASGGPPQAGSSWAEISGPQEASASPPWTGSSWAEITDAQAVSTISQGDSTAPHGQVVPRQRMLTPRQSAPPLKQPALTPREIVLSPTGR